MFVCGYIAETKIPLLQWKANLSPKSKKSNQIVWISQGQGSLYSQPIVDQIYTAQAANSWTD